ARCIEIWNLVFIQFNANPDGTFSPLPAKHVDTGMGFERVTSIIQGTKGFTDFENAKISNYETDIFRPIFDALEKMSGKTYRSTLPATGPAPASPKPDAPLKTVGEASGGIDDFTGDPKCLSGGQKEPTLPFAGLPEGQEASFEGKSAHLQSSGASAPGGQNANQEAIDIAFRVIADHIRTLSFAI